MDGGLILALGGLRRILCVIGNDIGETEKAQTCGGNSRRIFSLCIFSCGCRLLMKFTLNFVGKASKKKERLFSSLLLTTAH